MDQTDDRFPRYLAAMLRHGTDPVQVDTTIADLMVVTSALQLALRHPQMPRSIRESVEAFLEGVFQALQARDPVFGEIGRLGNDPANDVPHG